VLLPIAVTVFSYPAVGACVRAGVTLDFPKRIATVVGSAPLSDLLAAVANCGNGKFRATLCEPEAVQLHVDGMRCMKNCGAKVKQALLAVSGVSGGLVDVVRVLVDEAGAGS
jgi:hypothetical protein